MDNSNNTLRLNVNENGLTLIEWLRLAGVNINLANNTDASAWRKGVDPHTYKKR